MNGLATCSTRGGTSGISTEDGLFAFEGGSSEALRCIPMVVRFKLDRVGVRLALQQWRQLACAGRERLVVQPCETSEEVYAYRARLIADLLAQTDQPPKLFSPDPSPAWSRPEVVAESVVAWCGGLGLSPPGAACWARLSPLQRFTLTKLSRAGHKNDHFLAAMVEFGVLEAAHG